MNKCFAKNQNCPKLLVEVSHTEFKPNSLNRFFDYMGKPIYGFVKIKPYYGSMWLKILISRQLRITVFHIELKQKTVHQYGRCGSQTTGKQEE
jgi:hypothetical protein